MNTNTKQFDPTKPCRTRSGDPVKILTTDALGDLTIFYQNERTKVVYATLANGLTWKGGVSHHDLVNIPEKLVGWVNLYRKKDSPVGFADRFIFATEQNARANADDDTITRKIELEVL